MPSELIRIGVDKPGVRLTVDPRDGEPIAAIETESFDDGVALADQLSRSVQFIPSPPPSQRAYVDFAQEQG